MTKKWQMKNTKTIGRITGYTARVLMAVIVALSLAGPVPIRVEAAPSVPIDLQIGGEGATAWNIGNVKPGDSGTKVVNLHNAGTESGFVTIWVDEIVSWEGLNPESETGNKAEPGELDKYLLFGISSNRSSVTIPLPATIGKIPQSDSDPSSIEIVPLKPGETVPLEWSWSLPTSTGNDVQGDSVSFTINYLLREFESTNVSGSVTPGGVFTDNVTVTTNTTGSKLVISQNTTGKTKENQPLSEIWFIDTQKASSIVTANTSSVGTQYEAGPQGTTFDRPVIITMNYDPADIPARASEDDLVIATWDENSGKWTKLSDNIVNKINKTVTAQVAHFSRYTILVYVPPPPPPPPTPSPQPSPSIREEAPPPVTIPEVKLPARPIITTNILGDVRTVDIEADGTLLQPLKLTDPDGNFIIEVLRGSRIVSSNGTPVTRIEVTKVEQSDALPADTVILSSIYKVTGYIGESAIPIINFDPSARFTILYDPRTLPENAFPPYIANYTEEEGWIPLEPPPDSSFEIGKAKALVYHASLFAAVTKIAPPPLPLPAEFEASNLKISPKRVQQDKPVTITLTVANKGAVAASYELYLVVDGIVRAVQEITLAGFSSKTVSFEVSNLAPGTHRVKIAGLTGEFQAIEALITLPAETGVGWIFVDLSAAILICTLLIAIYLVIRRSQQVQESRVGLGNLVDTLRGRDKK